MSGRLPSGYCLRTFQGPGMTKSLVSLVVAALLCALIAPIALADRVRMKDGTVLEGTVLSQPYGYWVKTGDGKIHKVQSADVASVEKGNAGPPGAAAHGAAAPGAGAP